MTHPTLKKLLAGAYIAGAVIWALLLNFVAVLPRKALSPVINAAVKGIIWLAYTVFDASISSSTRLSIFNLSYFALSFLSFGLLSLLVWNLLRFKGSSLKRAILSLFSTSLLAVLFELVQFFSPDYTPKVSHCLLNIAGGAAAVAFITLACSLPQVFNRETVSYVVCGGFTTVVNMVVYGFCYNSLNFHNLISNTIAWIASVLFAYVVNKLFVFKSHNTGFYQVAREFRLFVGARLFSFGIDQLGMWILVDILRFNEGLSKAGVNVIVLVMNYFFSKLVIFKKSDKEQRA